MVVLLCVCACVNLRAVWFCVLSENNLEVQDLSVFQVQKGRLPTDIKTMEEGAIHMTI